MKLPDDYRERVYAAVLGKIIGVYLGRPFEGWSHDRISRELGDITGYVNARLGVPLVVTDDDITGTFTFLRALTDNGNRPDLSSRQVGEAWLDYIIEGRTILWWGGAGESTEHTAYLRLKDGIPSPESGSRKLNGRVVSEQIGAEIFIDGWALVSPGDPAQAVRLAGEAARVSHDGEAVYAAQVIAAMEAAAFVEKDFGKLIEAAVRYVPVTSTVKGVVDQVAGWCAREKDWRRVRALIEEKHGYSRYGGHVPAVPNFAVVLMALLNGNGDFQRSLMIANTSGWDTDCNSGNVGCLLGIRGGLSAFGSQDWRGPVADRMYLPTADGGRAITDAVAETYRIVAIGRSLAGEGAAPAPKGGARFHFEMPGSVQGFSVFGPATLSNVSGHSAAGSRSLAVRFEAGAVVRAATPTFIPPEALSMKGYELVASPTLYPGQVISVGVEADGKSAAEVSVKVTARYYGAKDEPRVLASPARSLAPGSSARISWRVPEIDGCPIFEAGIELAPHGPGTVYLDSLSWSGTPTVTFTRPPGGGEIWRRQWVNAFDHWGFFWPEAFRLSQDHGTGLLMTGCREWNDYLASAAIASDMATDFGLAIRVQGLRRFYALVVTAQGRVELRKERHGRKILGSTVFPWTEGSSYAFSLGANGNRLTARIDGKLLFDVKDVQDPLEGGGVALLCTQGSMAANEVRVEAV